MAEGTGGRSLDEVLRRLATAGEGDEVSVDDLFAAMGQRSFGPLLLAPSLIVVSPLSGIPGISTFFGIVIALIAGQLLLGRAAVWLPAHIRRRRIARRQLDRAVAVLAPAARIADKLVRPRLSRLTRQPFSQVIGGICLPAGLVMPLLEVVPFTSGIVASAVAVFAIALTAHDGALAIVALAIGLTSVYLVAGAIV